MRRLILHTVLLVALAAPAWPSDDRFPDYTLLWNRFTSVMVVDGYAVALSPDGVVVCEYLPEHAMFVQAGQLFLDDYPLAMKAYGDLLVVKTLDERLLYVDIGHLPEISTLGQFDPGVPFADFLLDGQNLYISAWFEGVWRFTLDGFNDAQFADSSMKGILVTQLCLENDTLYVLDEYNGIMRYDVSDGSLNAFVDYLYVPVRASGFSMDGALVLISAAGSGVLLGEFGHDGSGIIDSIDGLLAPQRTLFMDSTYVFLSNRVATLVNQDNYDQRLTIPTGDDLVDGDLIVLDGVCHLLLPGAEGGLVLYSLEDFVGPVVAFDRPGPVSDVLLYSSLLFTGGRANPVDVYTVGPETEPRLNYTIADDLTNVADMDNNGDTLIILYSDCNVVTLVGRSSNPDHFLEASFAVNDTSAFGIEFLDRWEDGSGLLVLGRTTISIYGISGQDIELAAAWSLEDEVSAVALRDSMLVVAGDANRIDFFRITPDLKLELRSSINVEAPIHELLFLDNYLVYFEFDLMNYIDLSDLELPVIETTVSMSVPVTGAVVRDDLLYTVGEDGVGVFSLDGLYPSLIDYGGRTGDFLSVDGNLMATTNGESVHLYFLQDGLLTDVDEWDTEPLPEQCVLLQNYPNPFNPHTWIDYSLPRRSSVRLVVFNLLGQVVRTIVDGERAAGHHTAFWDARDETGTPVASGVYFYRLTAGDVVESRKMVLIR
ncbi:MAG: T9SS type A sorting domain-containing protein [candidate division Zixibacteria bacterium]|nr:T9SS type A sorting domain-containing protein [candidate division Zixibacteria bacterium]